MAQTHTISYNILNQISYQIVITVLNINKMPIIMPFNFLETISNSRSQMCNPY